ncbi:tryptophan synthase subunit alpha [Streptomyces longwoodensis]|uniref:tryptophan synthase subunit alpha n=1 Tax=Streptomyces longwoodensis TaxID=68231 RepID=UPI0036FE1A93
MNSPAPSTPASRLDRVLAASHAQGRAALGLYLPLGYPSRTAGLDALHLMGLSADILEIGIPHTRPVLDGPVIREAVSQALAGFQMDDVFTAAADLTTATSAALLVMSYWAPIAHYGPTRFAGELVAAGGSGVLIPDLPLHAAASWRAAAETAGLHTVPFIPSYASAAHLAAIGASHSGMAYAPATPGLTGNPRPLSSDLPQQVQRLRSMTRLPIAVGIGVSTPDRAAHVSTFADAVVVGSAVIRRMRSHADPVAAAAGIARDFAVSVRRAQRSAA